MYFNPRLVKIIIVTLCMTQSLMAHAIENAAPADITQANQADIDEVISLVNGSRQLRSKLPAFIAETNQAIKTHQGALPAAYGNQLAKSLVFAEAQREALFNQALKHKSALYRVDKTLNDQARMDEIIIGMAAAVTLFENNEAMKKTLADNRLIKQKLNEGYPEYGIQPNFYDVSMLRANTPAHIKAMQDAINYFTSNQKMIAQYIAQSSTPMQQLYQVIADSKVLSNFKGANIFKEILFIPVKSIDVAFNVTGKVLDELKFTSSKVVGNSIGLVRWRSGKFKNDADMLQVMLDNLQPGDILLEKTPFTLSDKSIPGHFGHAAIFVGTPEQLQAIGASNVASIQAHLKAIGKGNNVVEALRKGVLLNPLKEFMNVDDVAILRLKNVTPQQQVEMVELALGNLGKKYDFNFDVNTTNKIVCSELVYLSYPQVDFITKRVLGSFTVSPDDIAVQAGEAADKPLALQLFAHDGKLLYAQDLKAPEAQTLYQTLVNPPHIVVNTPKNPLTESAQ
jgi:uncharacterized protein YycO